MEADSTTYENNPKALINELRLPFTTCPENTKLYAELLKTKEGKSYEFQLVEKLQSFGLIPSSIKCPTDKPDCNVICKSARVVDKVQWICQSCGRRQPIREGSFFLRLHCSILQVMQIVLAWCEDADLNVAAEHFGVKTKVATQIYDKLVDVAVREYKKVKLGGDSCVVLAEMFPDCLTRLSPDTTDQPHVHRILMLADTNHIPTQYKLEVIKEDPKKINMDTNEADDILKPQIEEIISNTITSGSSIITGNHVPVIEGAVSLQHLSQYCDVDMQHFLSSRVWRQAISVCTASRDICSTSSSASPPLLCASALQRYLHASLYRLRQGHSFYQHTLHLLAKHYDTS